VSGAAQASLEPGSPPAREGRAERRLLRRLLGALRLALAAALVAWALTRPGTAEALAALAARPWVLATLPVIGFAGVLLEAARLVVLVRAQGVPLSWRESLRVLLIGIFVNHALSGAAAGDLARLVLLVKSRPGARIEAGTALVVDRMLATGTLLVLVLALAAFERELFARSEVVRGTLLGLGAAAALLALLLALGLSQRVHARLAPRASDPSAPPSGWRAQLDRLSRALLAYRGHGGALAAGCALSLAGHGLLFGLLLLEGAFILPDAPAGAVLLLALLALVVNALPVTPGGLGVGEAASEALFGSVGLAGGPALLLGWRAAQLPGVVLGALVVAASGRRPRELLRAAGEEPG
jgi:uncharacterized membrane protein YbhN (UPF0104 family)